MCVHRLIPPPSPCCVSTAGEKASELERCSRYVVKLASRLDATIQGVHTIYIERKQRAVDRLLTAYIQVRAVALQWQIVWQCSLNLLTMPGWLHFVCTCALWPLG
jgi:hypothetical protein